VRSPFHSKIKINIKKIIKQLKVDELNVLPENHVVGKLVIHLPLIPDRSLSWV
jgi:hypothetical protein